MIKSFGCTALSVCFFLLFTTSCDEDVRMPQLLVEADSAFLAGKYNVCDSLLAIYQKQEVKSNDEMIIRYQELVELEQAYSHNNITAHNLRSAEDLCRYYSNGKKNVNQAKAYMLLGNAYDKNNDLPSALNAQLSAYEIANDVGDSRLLCLVSRELGDIYFTQKMYDQCIPYYKDYYELAVLNCDTLRMANAAHCMGWVYTIKQETDSCVNAFKLAIKLGENQHNAANTVLSAKSWLANIYIQIEEYDSARVLLTNTPDDDANWGYVYMAENKMDSAVVYFKKALGRYLWQGECEMLHKLAQIERDRGHYDEAFDYYEQLVTAKDSLSVQINNENIIRTEAQYNFTLMEQQRDMMEREKGRATLTAAILSVTSLLLLLLLLTLLVLYKRKKNIRRLQHNMQEAVMERQSILGERNESREKIEQQLKLFRESALYEKLLSCTNEEHQRSHMSHDDWNELKSVVDNIFHGFTDRVQLIYPLSEQEMQICYLTKTKLFSNAQIAAIMGRSPSAVSVSRKRMFRKITGDSGTANDFDDLIEKL